MAQVKKKAVRLAPAERRRSPRHLLCLDAEVTSACGTTSQVVVHELSEVGFLIEAATPLEVGQPLQLRLAEGEVIAARIVWSCGRHFGCESQRRLTSARVSAALLKARPARRTEGLPRHLRLETSNESGEEPLKAHARSQRLRFALGLSILLWVALAAALLYA